MIDDSYLVAAALLGRKSFEDLTAAGMEASALPSQQAALWDEIGRLYSADSELQSIPRALLDPAMQARFPNPKHARQLLDYLNGLPAHVSQDSVTDVYRRLKAYRVGLSLADALVKADADEAVPLARRYVELHDGRKTAKGVRGSDWNPRLGVEEIFEQEKGSGKIRAYPRRLNEVLRGGLRPGHNVLVFGRPESGKTLVTINCAAGMAAAGHRILYVCNEESQDAIQRRFLSRLGSVRLWDLDDSDMAVARAHYQKAVARASDRGWQNVNILHDASVRLSDIPRYIEQCEPQVLVLDQIRNIGIAGKNDDGLTRNLEIASRALREWGSEYGLVTFGVTQAGGTAEGRGHLTMNEIADSKTGAPGAYDLIMGAGVTEEMKLTGKRIISVVKNKVSGTETSFPIWIDPQYTAVRDAPVNREG